MNTFGFNVTYILNFKLSMAYHQKTTYLLIAIDVSSNWNEIKIPVEI